MSVPSLNNRYPSGRRPRSPIEEIEMLSELSDTEEDYSSDEEESDGGGEERGEASSSDEEESEHMDAYDAPLPHVNREIIVPVVPEPPAPALAPNGGGANGVPVMLTDPSVFDCCVCFDTLSIPVYQCINGHIICSPCCSKIAHKCPLCSMSIGDNRCRAIEAVLASIKTTCSNARYGCNAMPGCNWLSASNQLGQHLSEDHLFYLISFEYGEFFHVPLRHNKRLLVLQASTDGKLFVIKNQMEDTENEVFLYHIGPNSSVPQFHFEVKTMSDGEVLLPQTPVESTQNGTLGIPLSRLTFFCIPREMFSLSRWIHLQFRITTVSGATHSDDGPSIS
ncbi:E3 ubiquitin-protein ligase SINA 10 [Spatholobus suberectus]|nr:E3 ubiquitin-protein ligase SINA 10 [Spatholobus suberectus]